MAMIKCPECNNDVSDSANFCPKCGYKFSNVIGYTGNQYQGKILMILGTVIALPGALFFIGALFDSVDASTGSLGLIMLIVGILIKKVGKIKNWYHN